MDNMVDGSSNRIFTSAEKTKLGLLSTSTNINADSVDSAGAVMITDLPNSAGLLTTDGSGGLGVNTNTFLTSESDPKVGTISTSGSWCATDGSVINCDQATPVLQSDLGTGADNVVQLDGSSRLPAVDGSQLTNLNLSSPGTIGNIAPNTGSFSSVSARGLQLNDGGGDGTNNYLTLQSPNLVDDVTMYTLPPAPIDGMFLRTDSSGVLTWVNPNTSNDSDIAANASNIAANAASISSNSSSLSTKQNSVSGVDSSEIGYLDGVSSSIQDQIDSKAQTNHGHSAADITSGTIPLARGGTNATNASDARVNLGLRIGIDVQGALLHK